MDERKKDIFKNLNRFSKQMSELDIAKAIRIEPIRLIALEKKLSERYNKVPFPSSSDLTLLEVKVKLILQNKLHDDFSRKEKKKLIFLLGLQENFCINGYIDYILENAEMKRLSGFRNAVYMYFSTYDVNGIHTKKLRDKILKIASIERIDFNRIKYLVDEPKLINYNGHTYLASHLVEGLNTYLKRIGFPDALFTCRFVKEAVIYFYNNVQANVENKINILLELEKTDKYEDVFGNIAGSIIQTVNNSGISDYKDILIRILNKKLGDPRHSIIKWNPVPEGARRIFLSWLNKGTLDLFFKIVLDGVIEPGERRAVQYRIDFWSKYIEDMGQTWVMLGQNALISLRRVKNSAGLGYGELLGTNSQKCLFMFEIGDYVFVEPSYGTLRIWHKRKYPIPFGSSFYYYYKLVGSNADEEIRHTSPSTYSWQRKARDWIRLKCNIYKDYK